MMPEYDFTQINLLGRLCYLFMCMERYLTVLWPDRDWTIAAEHLWQWISSSDWTCAREQTDELIPAYIFSGETYEEVNGFFGGTLNADVYEQMLALYQGITDGDPADEINQVLSLTADWGDACEGTSFLGADQETQKILYFMISVLDKHAIPPPDLRPVRDLTPDQFHGWGIPFDARSLSVILNRS